MGGHTRTQGDGGHSRRAEASGSPAHPPLGPRLELEGTHFAVPPGGPRPWRSPDTLTGISAVAGRVQVQILESDTWMACGDAGTRRSQQDAHPGRLPHGTPPFLFLPLPSQSQGGPGGAASRGGWGLQRPRAMAAWAWRGVAVPAGATAGGEDLRSGWAVAVGKGRSLGIRRVAVGQGAITNRKEAGEGSAERGAPGAGVLSSPWQPAARDVGIHQEHQEPACPPPPPSRERWEDLQLPWWSRSAGLRLNQAVEAGPPASSSDLLR